MFKTTSRGETIHYDIVRKSDGKIVTSIRVKQVKLPKYSLKGFLKAAEIYEITSKNRTTYVALLDETFETPSMGGARTGTMSGEIVASDEFDILSDALEWITKKARLKAMAKIDKENVSKNLAGRVTDFPAQIGIMFKARKSKEG